MSHTPGPWEARCFPALQPDLPTFWEVVRPDARDRDKDDPNRTLICDCGALDNNEANARLIAAAPDLLAACKKALSLCRTNGDGLVSTQGDLEKAIAAAEAVTPTAEGTTP